MTKEYILQVLKEEFHPTFSPRPQQMQIFEVLVEWLYVYFTQGYESCKHLFIDAPTGCHAKGTKLLMYDGTLKKVEDIKVGDQLMGPDSKPRNVLELYRGRENMAQIIPKKGDSFIVNESHILSLVRTCRDSIQRNGKKRRPDFEGIDKIVNISVKEYLTKSKTFKHTHKLYRTGVEFEKKQDSLEIDPYILGLWLGDGTTTAPHLTSCDYEIQDAWRKYGISQELLIREKWRDHKTALMCYTSRGEKRTSNKNIFIEKLRYYKLEGAKHIPLEYLTNSRENRLNLLAGILDSDGHYIASGKVFEISQKSKTLAEDIAFLARSLGFLVTSKEEEKKCQTGASGIYHRMHISGNCNIIPTRVARKKAEIRIQKKDPLRTGFKVIKLPEDDYYGFELDQDHLYLMSDFLVTHNTGKSLIAMTLIRAHRRLAQEFEIKLNQTFLITERKILQDQYAEEFQDQLFNFKGLGNYPCYFDQGKSCSESKCGRVSPKKGQEGVSFPEVCTKQCGYDEAVRQSTIEPVILTNSAKYVNIMKYHLGRLYEEPSLVIYDEGHNVENLLDSEAALDLSSSVFERLELDMNEYFRGVMQTTPPESLQENLSNLATRLNLISSAEEISDPSVRNVKKIRMIENLTDKIKEVLRNPENFVLNFDVNEFRGKTNITLEFKSKYIHKAFRTFFEKPTVFLSATLLSKQGVQTMTGLKDEEMEWISVGTPFKVENRKMYNYWYMGAKPLNYRNMSEEFPNAILRIKTLLEKYPNSRGIIHAQSYNIAIMIFEALQREFGSRLIYPKSSREQVEALDTLGRIPDGVLLSPSMTEGVDLKGDLCRFVIMVKLPYLKTVDPVTKLRMKTLPNWYEFKSCMTIVQAVGRGVRNEEDYANTYFVDPEFGRFMSRASALMPSWFLEAWERMPSGPV